MWIGINGAIDAARQLGVDEHLATCCLVHKATSQFVIGYAAIECGRAVCVLVSTDPHHPIAWLHG